VWIPGALDAGSSALVSLFTARTSKR
jgi:hypothetical protein